MYKRQALSYRGRQALARPLPILFLMLFISQFVQFGGQEVLHLADALEALSLIHI